MATPTQLLRRVLDTVRRDETVRGLVGTGNDHYRVGSYKAVERSLNVLPLVYATLPPSYLHSRQVIGGPVAPRASPREVVTYVLNLICVSHPQGDTLEAQLEAFGIADACMEALYRNLTLADEAGGDHLAHDLEIVSMGRHLARVGTELEAQVLMIHVRTTLYHGADGS